MFNTAIIGCIPLLFSIATSASPSSAVIKDIWPRANAISNAFAITDDPSIDPPDPPVPFIPGGSPLDLAANSLQDPPKARRNVDPSLFGVHGTVAGFSAPIWSLKFRGAAQFGQPMDLNVEFHANHSCLLQPVYGYRWINGSFPQGIVTLQDIKTDVHGHTPADWKAYLITTYTQLQTAMHQSVSRASGWPERSFTRNLQQLRFNQQWSMALTFAGVNGAILYSIYNDLVGTPTPPSTEEANMIAALSLFYFSVAGIALTALKAVGIFKEVDMIVYILMKLALVNMLAVVNGRLDELGQFRRAPVNVDAGLMQMGRGVVHGVMQNIGLRDLNHVTKILQQALICR